jgi:OmpA-OmpF porin, OOP family
MLNAFGAIDNASCRNGISALGAGILVTDLTRFPSPKESEVARKLCSPHGGIITVATSPLTFFSQSFPSNAVHSLAGNLGTSEKTVLDGIKTSIAAVVNGLSQRSGDRALLGQTLQAAQSTPENAVSSALSSGALTNPNSSFMASGNKFLSSIFGNKLGSVTDAIGSQTGLRGGAASTLLALGGQSVLGSLGKGVRDGSVNENNLPGVLAHQSEELEGMLPGTFRTVGSHRVEVDPVVAQSVKHEEHHRTPWAWLLLPLALLALLFGIWGAHNRRMAAIPHVTPPAMPAINAPAAPAVPNIPTTAIGTQLGHIVPFTLPGGTILHMPEHGSEANLLAFLRDPNKTPDETSWFNLSRSDFATDSATLTPQSTDELNNVAQIMKAYPGTHLKIGGYADSSGDAAHNMSLSQARADSVVSALTSRGIAANRLTAQGYGDQYPRGDNGTENGRAMNRHAAMLVTQK